jgi:hypothetical protein
VKTAHFDRSAWVWRQNPQDQEKVLDELLQGPAVDRVSFFISKANWKTVVNINMYMD